MNVFSFHLEENGKQKQKKGLKKRSLFHTLEIGKKIFLILIILFFIPFTQERKKNSTEKKSPSFFFFFFFKLVPHRKKNTFFFTPFNNEERKIKELIKFHLAKCIFPTRTQKIHGEKKKISLNSLFWVFDIKKGCKTHTYTLPSKLYKYWSYYSPSRTTSAFGQIQRLTGLFEVVCLPIDKV